MEEKNTPDVGSVRVWTIVGMPAVVLVLGYFWYNGFFVSILTPEETALTLVEEQMETSATSTVNEPVEPPKPQPVAEPKPPTPKSSTQKSDATETTTSPSPPAANHSGNWQGTFAVTKPGGCAGYSGTWNLNLKDDNGILSGSFSSTDGTSGTVAGAVVGTLFTFDVLNAGQKVMSVGWYVSGGDTSGTFERVKECYSGSGPVSGTMQGKKIQSQ